MGWHRFLTRVVLVALPALLVVPVPVAAEGAIRRCDVTPFEPRRPTPNEPDVAIEGSLACDRAVLPERFNFGVCLQAKEGARFVDVYCCRVIKIRVSSTPWLMCAEGAPLRAGTHEYRTRARADRLASGTKETRYSAAVTFTR